jgi:large conductance mechanosensitive channel
MLKEFREFVARGNVIDLAIGVIMGAAFGRVVESLVKDVLMPPLGALTGGVDFSDLYISLSGQRYPSLAAAKEAGAATINYGVFINSIIQFLLVALGVFMIVKWYNRINRAHDVAPAAPTEQACPYCMLKIPIGAKRCGYCTSEIAA